MNALPIGLSILVFLLAGLIGLVVGYLLSRALAKKKITDAAEKASQILKETDKEIEIKRKELELKARTEWLNAKSDFEHQTQAQRAKLERLEKKLYDKEESISKRASLLHQKEKELQSAERAIKNKEMMLRSREREIDELIEKQNKQLEQIARLTEEEAKRILMENLESKARAEAAARVKEIKEKAEKEAEKEAKNIITQAIQRVAADHTIESSVSVVPLPNDEMKGRIIGREGRNIRAFEVATGVDIIVDDTPEAVILSAYDPIRREIARISLEKLVLDGRIHPSRIEEVVKKSEKEVEVLIQESGEQVAFELGIHNLHPEIVKLLGRLRFRTSYGQNVLEHSREVAQLAGFMATELDLDTALAKRAGLLHDIGKAIDKGTEGTHTQLGYELAKKYGENEVVLNAIAAHHEDVEVTSLYTVLVQAADTISGARPGARRETFENYIKRLEKLESLADSFDGVAKAYAIQAGREIRVMVEPMQVSDNDSQKLATEIAQKIQEEMEYPGQIKVTVIRETRAVNYAK